MMVRKLASYVVLAILARYLDRPDMGRRFVAFTLAPPVGVVTDRYGRLARRPPLARPQAVLYGATAAPQRVPVPPPLKPDVLVRPTIAGIRAVVTR
jgi:hypothetical protein